MSIDVRLRCSECSLIRDVRMGTEHKELTCPLCGRRRQNLTEDEIKEVEEVQKKQQLCSYISIGFFLLALICGILWASSGCPISGKQLVDGRLVDAIGDVKGNEMLFAATVGCALVGIVLSFMASRKRFVVEF